MFSKIEIFDMARGLLGHSAARQSVIAQNMANADTPGFRARDMAAFSDSYRVAEPDLRPTRPGHIMGGGDATAPARLHDSPGRSAPNGNTVSLENEMIRALDVSRQHEMALSVYRSSLNILRSSLGRQ
ncbi:MAG: FlgB family protein [Paracoccaceae bacterium]